MSSDSLHIRIFSEPLSEEERHFYGLDATQHARPRWPESCVNDMKPAAARVVLTAEGRNEAVTMHAPVCAEHAEARQHNYGWVTTAGLWMTYIGIFGFFLSLFFYFGLSTGKRFAESTLFLGAVSSLVLLFFGFYFVRLMQSISPAFRKWLAVPAVRTRLARSTPYFHDVTFRFENADYGAAFAKLNSHLNVEKRDGEANERLEQLKERTVERPEDADAWLNLGLGFERMGRLREAEQALQKARSHAPESAEVLRHLGAVRFAAGKGQEAEAALLLANKLEPDQLDTLLLLAALYEAQGKRSRAESRLKDAERLAPEDSLVLERIGDYYTRFQRWEEAEALFRKALEADNTNTRALAGYALVLLKQQKLALARRHIKQLEDQAPHLASGLLSHLQRLESN